MMNKLEAFLKRKAREKFRGGCADHAAGLWHGARFVFGLHYDLHASGTDTELGRGCALPTLVHALREMAPDFVQTDCKGHPGYASWFSRTPTASVPPGLKHDALRQWRRATRQLGLPLHCHYSGIWDQAAGREHPDWCMRTADGAPNGAPFGQNAGAPVGERMCPLGPYLRQLMIPQMIELIDRYDVDGFWIDGDLWAVEPCYCPRCREAFTRRTGLAEPPVREDSPDWPIWWNFTRENFEAYVTAYCEAIHRHKPGVLVCSNWLQSFNHPGPPGVPTDWISGDGPWLYGMDACRCEARFISTRGKPWDVMLWNAVCTHPESSPAAPRTAAPPQMLMQQAAAVLAFGGNVQLYEAHAFRDGRLVPWRMRRLGEVGRFVKRRRALCRRTETFPQVAVLHSEHHLRSTVRSRNLMWGLDTAPVKGAVYALLETHAGVDVLDEWALLPQCSRFPVVVVPEQHGLSESMVDALVDYVRGGGRLLISGAELLARFGASFLGVTSESLCRDQTFFVPAGDGWSPLYSRIWHRLEIKGARGLALLAGSPFPDHGGTAPPAATINRVGKGAVAYIPADVFRDFEHNRHPMTRVFIGDVLRKLAGRQLVRVEAPTCVDVVWRQKRGRLIIHLINRASGLPGGLRNTIVDEIPPVGPITLHVPCPVVPASVQSVWRSDGLSWRHAGRRLTIRLNQLHIHEAIRIAEATTQGEQP